MRDDPEARRRGEEARHVHQDLLCPDVEGLLPDSLAWGDPPWSRLANAEDEDAALGIRKATDVLPKRRLASAGFPVRMPSL